MKKDGNIFFKSFDDFLSKYSLYFLFSIIALIVFCVFKDFILLKKIYLFKDIGSDSINISYPSFYSLADYIIKDGFPKWSFNQGMGQNIFPSLDPFSLYIISMGKSFVYYTIFYAEILKIFCAGLFFYLFLKKIISSDYTALIGAVLYSFSGFIILGGGWNVFSTQAVYVALLLYSFEKLYQDDNWILFPVSIFLIASHQPLDLYFIGFFLVIYTIFRLFEAGEKEPKKISGLFTKLLLLGLTGLAMSAFFFINGLQILMESPRGSGSTSYFNTLFSTSIFGLEGETFGKTHYLTALMRFFSCDILGTGSKFKGWHNYLEAPLFYCGLISLVLLPHFLSLSEKRKKMIYFVFILTFIIPVIFPFFRYAFWLFTGNYYRIFSFFVAVAILLIALKSMEDIESKSQVNIKITTVTLLLLLFFLYYPYKNAQIIDKDIRNTAAIFLIIYSALVYLIQFKKIKNIVKITLLSVIIIELTCFHYAAVNKRPAISGEETVQKIGYNDYTIDAVEFIKSHDKTFFRINKDYYSGTSIHSSMNEAKVQDFYGTPSYQPFNQLNYIKFLQELGIIKKQDEFETRWAPGLINYPILHSFASIKYSLSKNQKSSLLNQGYNPMIIFGNVKVLKNTFALPLGFTYEKYIALKDFKVLPQDQKMIALYKAVIIDDRAYKNFSNLQKFNLQDIPQRSNYPIEKYAKDIELLDRNTLNISKHSQNKITGTINTDKSKMLFFSIPFDKGWNAKVDGKSVKAMMVNIGFTGVPVEKGLHNIELSFTPLYFHTGAVISLIAVILFICLIAFKRMRVGKFN
ncbi:MAG: YfhO family protein [Smithella sp.]